MEILSDPTPDMLAMPRFDDGAIDMQELLRRLAEQVVNAVMDAEADQLCGGGGNSRNGYRERSLATCVGTLTLRIPKLRSGSFFPEDVLERYQRVDRALVAAVAEMYATGTSTRKVQRVAEKMGVSRLSKDQVSAIATSYPAYLTDDPVELKDINSAIAMFSNVSIIVGPTLGGFVAAAASSRAVFVLMMLFTALALIAGWSFKPRAGFATTREGKPATGEITSDNPSTSARATFAASIKTVFTNSVLALLFCIIFLSNFGYGAFDPLESFFYRDVLHVGVEWMGWLSSASGVGAVLGAMVALRLPPHLVNLKTLLVALMSVGLGSLLYVGTPYVGVALVGQIALGVAWGVVNPLHNTIVQTTAPLEQLGRVNSVMGFGNMFAGVAPLVIAPWLAATFGVQQTLVGAGMVVTAVPAALLLFGRRHFDRAARQ